MSTVDDSDGSEDAIDRNCDYYRVLGERAGYFYRPGEPAIMAAGSGLVRAEEPYFEFDPLATVGRWLFLGGQVRRLRVPPDAVVERNTPMSQGGCYRWSADRVELLEILEFPALMRAYDVAGICAGTLHFADYEFPAGFRFPARVRSIVLHDCLACDRLDFPAELENLTLWGCAIEVGTLPATLEFFAAYHTMFTGLAAPPAWAAGTDVNACSFAGP